MDGPTNTPSTPPRPRPAGRRWLLILAIAVIAAPAAYLFVAVQHGAITRPYWDHVELVKFIGKAYDGTLQVSDLWAPHNHTRPLLYRAIYVANARLTDWDLRSEYAFLLASLYGAFAVHALALRRLTGGKFAAASVAGLALVSVIFFSPVGHNNHWWSMMLQLDLANLLALIALWRIAAAPRAWSSHIVAALCCWGATYTLTNGIVALIACLMTTALAEAAPRHDRARWSLIPGPRTLFWLANLLLLLALYAPGLPETGGTDRPGPIKLVWFILIYLGNPLANLIEFGFRDPWYPSAHANFAGICGVILLIVAALALWSRRRAALVNEPGPRHLIAFALYAGGSALLTAWGRAKFDEPGLPGILHAAASRYTITGSYLLYGLIAFAVYLGHRGSGPLAPLATARTTLQAITRSPIIRALLAIAFLALATRTYIRGAEIYRFTHRVNQELAESYPVDLSNETGLWRIHPVPEVARSVRETLLKHRLGPYSGVVDRPHDPFPPDPTFRAAEGVTAGRTIRQGFDAPGGALAGFRVRMVTWGATPAPYDIIWRLRRPDGSTLAEGNWSTGTISDWAWAQANLAPLPIRAGEQLILELTTENHAPGMNPAGVALYDASASGGSLEPVEIDGQPRPLALHLVPLVLKR